MPCPALLSSPCPVLLCSRVPVPCPALLRSRYAPGVPVLYESLCSLSPCALASFAPCRSPCSHAPQVFVSALPNSCGRMSLGSCVCVCTRACMRPIDGMFANGVSCVLCRVVRAVPCRVVSCYVVSRCVVSCPVVTCPVVTCCLVPCCAVSCGVVSHRVMSCVLRFVALCCIALCCVASGHAALFRVIHAFVSCMHVVSYVRACVRACVPCAYAPPVDGRFANGMWE